MEKKRWILRTGEAPAALRGFKSEWLHAIITDPPAGIGYQCREWDGDLRAQKAKLTETLAREFRKYCDSPEALRAAQQVYGPFVPHPWTVWLTGIFDEYWRILKPGGWFVCWTHARTKHRVKEAMERAGFRVVDEIAHVFGTGFPKSVNLDVAIDRAHGWERNSHSPPETAEAARWYGQGTALKPAREDWVLAQKPRAGTVARTAMTHGTGTLSIDDASIEGPDGIRRFPTNLIPEDTSILPTHGRRFFWAPKPGTTERDAGLQGFDTHEGHDMVRRKKGHVGVQNPRAGAGRISRRKNDHPTVKSIDLCRYLVLLVTRKGQIIGDFFVGSGSIGCAAVIEGRRFVGLDMDNGNVRLTRARIKYWAAQRVAPLEIKSGG